MESIKKARNHQLFVRDLRHVVTIYQQLAVMDMQTIRDAVLQTRASMDGLLDIFMDVHQAQRKEVEKLLEKKSRFVQQTLMTSSKNGKHATLLITPASKFSGPIGHEVFDAFAQWIETNNSEIFLFGQLGQEHFRERFPQRSFQARAFPNSKEMSSQLSTILNEFLSYERIDVFHGRFHSLVKQTAQVTNVTGDAPLQSVVTTDDSQPVAFLFEPSLQDILTFFEAQLFAQLLQQTFREAKLSHLGSRISALEGALSGIEQQQHAAYRAVQKAQRRQSQRKQLQRLAGAVLWS